MLHTNVPSFSLNQGRFKEDGKFYQSTVRKLPKGTGIQLREVTNYGAVLELITGSSITINLEYHQLSKKKVTYRDMVFYFYDHYKSWDDNFVKHFKEEVMKHGMLLINKEE